MTLDTWLRVGAIGLPLFAALIIRCWGHRSPDIQRRLAALVFCTTGLLALTLFLLNRYHACILAFGKQSCLFDGAATLSLLALSVFWTRASLVLRGTDPGGGHITLLLLCAAWAGMGLARNLALFLVFLYLFYYAVDRWLRRKGLAWRFLVLRDDYADDV